MPRALGQSNYFWKCFYKYKKKIDFYYLEDLPKYNGNNLDYEYFIKNQIKLGLKDLEPEDIILISDADEIPNEYLIQALPYILEANDGVEAYWVPRVNTVAGITDDHIAKWGWRLNEQGWVNFPDWQMRLYKNDDNIYWIKPVHEQLKGFRKFANLPPEEKFCLYHPKDIGRQEKQNAFYETI